MFREKGMKKTHSPSTGLKGLSSNNSQYVVCGETPEEHELLFRTHTFVPRGVLAFKRALQCMTQP